MNIYTKPQTGEKKKAVLAWIYGGGRFRCPPLLLDAAWIDHIQVLLLAVPPINPTMVHILQKRKT
jgi:hypothetical protein